MIDQNRSAKIYFLFITLFLGSCASTLSIKVMDDETGHKLNNITVEANQIGKETRRIQTIDGVATIEKIDKNFPIIINIPKNDNYFSKKDTLAAGEFNSTMKLVILQTVLKGTVLAIPHNIPVKGCKIITDPPTDSVFTNKNGDFELRSKLFDEDQPYDLKVKSPDKNIYEDYTLIQQFFKPKQERIFLFKLKTKEGFDPDKIIDDWGGDEFDDDDDLKTNDG